MNARARAKRNLWIEAAAVLIFCAFIGAWFIISSTRPLDAAKLAIHAGDLRSFSASASLLSDQFSNGNVTGTFFHEQTELLRDKVDDVRETLETSDIAPELTNSADRLKDVSKRVGIILESDNVAGHNYELKNYAASLRSLEDALKKEADK